MIITLAVSKPVLNNDCFSASSIPSDVGLLGDLATFRSQGLGFWYFVGS